ncbi:MAG TPA: tRNA uridine-5-carboxymethylaminomethyl(34) synthesis GTPase MnmE [Clostridiales bacterium]|nr:tRNA uridine-5-carboxymethylaminomethyl(34) synthesis GTPase MnmE [Eubacteriales bacterium]HBR32108.1 tRNA uridine-5-carboxymethylaminomethyl(34) synthesis GTPase MnmE [Clostridiales bacterium]
MRTIAAISTPLGRGGVSMIRITGDMAFEVASGLFVPKSGLEIDKIRSNSAVYGSFFDKDGVFDDGILILYRAPKSYTGENTVELCCHGGLLVTKKLLEAAITAGASYADAGEFTKRAFINGRITLSQAEAIGGIIDAKNEKHLAASVLQSEGTLSKKIASLSEKLAYLAASVYAYIDYPDEDLREVTAEEMKSSLILIRDELEQLAGTHRYGQAISEGIKTVIIGKPNTGKSSVLNALTGYDRAIVTDIAGTTRDIITEQIRLGDLMLNLSDTAGIRESADFIENIGIEKSKRALYDAELVLAVFDGSQPFDEEDSAIVSEIKAAGKEDCTIYLLNKSDLGTSFPDFPIKRQIEFSAVCGIGKDKLERLVAEMFGEGEISSLGEVILSARQFGALNRARTAVDNALSSLDTFTQDISGIDVEEAIACLGELDGRSVSEQVVNEIFSHFCVGK